MKKWNTEKVLLQDIQNKRQRVEQLNLEAETAERNGDYGKVAEIRYGKLAKLNSEIDELSLKKDQEKDPILNESVGPEDIAEVVAKWTGIPVNRMLESEKDKLLRMPLDTDKVNSTYRYRGRRPHRGTDLKLSVGDTVRAAFDGVVRIAELTRDTGGYGNLIVIRHPNGLETYYGHLSRHLVATGDLVKAGEPIGIGGSTGRSTGPHLHFETRYQGHAFDPERIFDFQAGVIRDSSFELHKQYFDIRSHYGQTQKQYASESAAQYIKIRKGDTLGGIATRNGTTITRLCSLNGITRKTVLRVGKSLRVR